MQNTNNKETHNIKFGTHIIPDEEQRKINLKTLKGDEIDFTHSLDELRLIHWRIRDEYIHRDKYNSKGGVFKQIGENEDLFTHLEQDELINLDYHISGIRTILDDNCDT